MAYEVIIANRIGKITSKFILWDLAFQSNGNRKPLKI